MEKELLNLDTAMSYGLKDVPTNEVKIIEKENEFTFELGTPRNGGIQVRSSGRLRTISEDRVNVRNLGDKIVVEDIMTSGFIRYVDDDPCGLIIENTCDKILYKVYSIKEIENNKYLSIETTKVINNSGTHDSYGGDKGNGSYRREDLGEKLIPVDANYRLLDGLDEISFERVVKTKK